MRNLFLRVAATLVVSMALTPMALAQYGRSDGLSNRTTAAVVRLLQGDFRECGDLIIVFRYDCYSQSYRSAADRLDGLVGYAEAQTALRLVETRIGSVVSANRDRTRPPLRQGGRVFNAVTEEAIPLLRRETLRAMDEAQTVLLRSPTAAQRPHYSRIAAVIDSNKVLLRSALLLIDTGLRRIAGLIFQPSTG